jgi:hypothetical protein
MHSSSNAHSIDFLRKILSYDPKTGDFYHLPRTEEMFETRKAYRIWKALYEGKRAFGNPNPNGYFRTKILGISYYAHRLAWAHHYGHWPTAEIDHINGDRADNRIENLRSVDRIENCRNLKRPHNNTSGVIGVSWVEDRQKWQAYIDDNVGRIPLGRYDEFYQAVIARKAAETALRYHPNHGRG